MNELKDRRLLNGVGLQQVPDNPKAALDLPKTALDLDVDLDLLADQLSLIAGELRRSDAHQKSNAGQNRPSDDSASNSARIVYNRPPNPQPAKKLDRNLGFSDPQTRRVIHAKAAREIYENRRRRAALFDNAELFGEPAWDILLDLYIAHAENKPVSVSSACIGSASPPTTGLRWLGVLTDNKLILREHDPEDQRRVLVRLTERGLAAMDRYFSGAGPST